MPSVPFPVSASRLLAGAVAGIALAGCGSQSVPRPPLDTPSSELASPGAHLTDGDAVVRAALVNASIAEVGYYDDHTQAYTPSTDVLEQNGLAAADAQHVTIVYANATTYCLQGIGDGLSATWYYTSSGDHPGLTTAAC